ncbi:MAG: hypothetical protein LBC39_02660 [Methanobrevibacter sp.]|jgi:hypothetical protein|nr:hypothetical protein [Candidatus Methanovirga aequatorialis]
MAEYISTKAPTDFILENDVLPLFVEERVRTSLQLLQIVGRRQAKDGQFDVVVEEPTYKEFKAANKKQRAGEASDFKRLKGLKPVYDSDKTKLNKYYVEYTKLKRENDTMGDIPREIADTALMLAEDLNDEILDKTIAYAQGSAIPVGQLDWVNNPIEANVLIKNYLRDQDGHKYNLNQMFIVEERYEEFIKALYQPDYHIAFSNVYGTESALIVGEDGVLMKINKLDLKYADMGADYFAIDDTAEYGAIYSNLENWGFSYNTSALTEQGDVPIAYAEEETQNFNVTDMRTSVLSDAGFGIRAPRAVVKGDLVAH